MANIVEMVAEIVAAHASSKVMSTEEVVAAIQNVHATLSRLEAGQSAKLPTEETTPALTVRQAFKKDEVICMVCGKGKMKALARHLTREHGLKPSEYRKQFGIPRSQPLTAKTYSEQRRKSAEERGMGEVLVKAREARANKAKAKPKAAAAPVKAVPAKGKLTTKGKGKAAAQAA